MENRTTHNPRPDVQKLGDLIKGIKYAMFTTVDEQGFLRSRPMATEEISFDGDLWFFTSAGTPKVAEIRQHGQVNVSYADSDSDRFVSVSGRAQIVEDRGKMKELWSPLYRGWFPKGLEDPELVLIKVSAERAQYWDASEHRMVHLYSMAKSILTGKKSKTADNLAHKVQLHR